MKNDNHADMVRVIEQMNTGGFGFVDDWDMSTTYFSKVNHRGEWLVSVTEPHEGNNYKWLVRANKHETFDKWGNADFQEYYDDINDFMEHALIDLEEEITYKNRGLNHV